MVMDKAKALKKLESIKNVRFSVLLSICETFFTVREGKGSHKVVSLPDGKPYAIQNKNGMAQPYQVMTIREVIEELEES